MTEKAQYRIDQLAAGGVGVSWLIIVFFTIDSVVVCGPGAAEQQLLGKLKSLWFTIPGFLLGVLSSSIFDRLFSWAGWIFITWFCWAAYQQISR